MTAIITPVYCTHKGVYLGANVKFVVELTGSSGPPEIVPLLSDDHEVQRFRNFRLTRESLESKATLEQLLQQQVDNGALTSPFAVYDLSDWQAQTRKFYLGPEIEARPFGFFEYHVLGTLWTKYDQWKLNRENAKRKARRPPTTTEDRDAAADAESSRRES
jgi:hypothetical protein